MTTTPPTLLRRLGHWLTRSIPLGTWAGAPLRLHCTLWWLLVGVVVLALTNEADTTTADRVARVFAYLVVASVFIVSVALHEYGHVAAARRLGHPTSRVVLTPIGGVAMLRTLPTTPRGELLVALAGPAVSLALWLLALAVTAVTAPAPAVGDPTGTAALSAVAHSIASLLAMINRIMFLFNLIPILPMDGGRVLRALLNIPFGIVRATRLASHVAGLGLVAGLLWAWQADRLAGTIPFIAVMIGLGALGENRRAAAASRLTGLTAGDFLRGPAADEFDTAPTAPRLPATTPAPALRFRLDGGELDGATTILVTAPDGAVLGLLDRAALLRGTRGDD